MSTIHKSVIMLCNVLNVPASDNPDVADQNIQSELKYYKPPHGFEEDATFTDGRALFDALWQEWFDTTLYLTAKKMQLDNIIYEEVFNCLSKEKQSSIIAKKADFARKAGITL